MSQSDYILWFKDLSLTDIEKVGGKNASLGEMIQNLNGAGIAVPNGFATTATAYREFLQQGELATRIQSALEQLDINDVNQLAKTARDIRQWILETPFSDSFNTAIQAAYEMLVSECGAEASFAVRSSATAEDLPQASFAGQQETYLNVQGEQAILTTIKQVFASLFTDRAIAYREHHYFDHDQVYLSAGIQRMVRSDLASSGVMFSLDTESGFDQVVFITSSYGLGESVVQGSVNPDEFYIDKRLIAADKPAILRRSLGSKESKMIYANSDDFVQTIEVPLVQQNQFSLNDEEVQSLAKMAITIEQHYQRPVDIEWGKDGQDGKLYILQARPETVKSREDKKILERFQLHEQSTILAEGRAVGQRIGTGRVRLIQDLSQMDSMQTGDVLVTDMTDPDWEPIMKRASAIVTNRGGRTCHAAIIARELGVPAVVGCGDATQRVEDGTTVTVVCSEGETGFVYAGKLNYEVKRTQLNQLPELPVKIMLNVGNPDLAFSFSSTPNAGVGLARLEFIISNTIGIHPQALLNFDSLAADLQNEITERIAGYKNPKEFYIEKLREGIATLAASFQPGPVIVRLSDFKSNEYANLIGGEHYEPDEENPMIGFRGASRYVREEFSDCFAMECEAIKRVRNEMGLTNVEIMIPFVRTVEEAKTVIDCIAEHGLKRGENGLRIIMMCEIPSNAILAEQFLDYFDGFSIGSNDLTQLTLGLDRDSALVAEQFDERNEAVKRLLSQAIQACKNSGKYIGICGQGPSDHPDFAEWLIEQGIDSLSLNPDSVLETWLFLAGEK